MRHAVEGITVAVLATVALAAASVKFTSTWKSPSIETLGFKGQKVIALVMSRDVELQMSAEEALTRELSALGVQAVPAYRLIPREALSDTSEARGFIERAGARGVVVLRPVEVTKERVYAPSTWTQGYYTTLWGYYGYGWTGIYSPGASREDLRLVVETLVYDVPRDKLLWAGVSETTNPKNVQQFLKDLVSEALKVMRRQGLV